MPAFIVAILGGLIQVTGSIVGRVLVALGLSVVTYQGVDTSLTWLKDQAIASAQGLPPEIFQLLVFLKVGESISIISSAVAVRLLVSGLNGSTVKRWVLK